MKKTLTVFLLIVVLGAEPVSGQVTREWIQKYAKSCDVVVEAKIGQLNAKKEFLRSLKTVAETIKEMYPFNTALYEFLKITVDNYEQMIISDTDEIKAEKETHKLIMFLSNELLILQERYKK